jgi:hypothetical protein
MSSSDSSWDSAVELFIGKRVPVDPPAGELKSALSGESVAEEEDEGWEVEKIVGERIRQGKRQYQLKWKGWNSSDNTWEDEENLNCDLLLQEYREQKQAARLGRRHNKGRSEAAERPQTKAAPAKTSKAAPVKVSKPTRHTLTFRTPDLQLGKLLPKVKIVGAVEEDGGISYLVRVGTDPEVAEPSCTVRAKYPSELAAFLENRALSLSDFRGPDAEDP